MHVQPNLTPDPQLCFTTATMTSENAQGVDTKGKTGKEKLVNEAGEKEEDKLIEMLRDKCIHRFATVQIYWKKKSKEQKVHNYF